MIFRRKWSTTASPHWVRGPNSLLCQGEHQPIHWDGAAALGARRLGTQKAAPFSSGGTVSSTSIQYSSVPVLVSVFCLHLMPASMAMEPRSTALVAARRYIVASSPRGCAPGSNLEENGSTLQTAPSVRLETLGAVSLRMYSSGELEAARPVACWHVCCRSTCSSSAHGHHLQEHTEQWTVPSARDRVGAWGDFN